MIIIGAALAAAFAAGVLVAPRAAKAQQAAKVPTALKIVFAFGVIVGPFGAEAQQPAATQFVSWLPTATPEPSSSGSVFAKPANGAPGGLSFVLIGK